MGRLPGIRAGARIRYLPERHTFGDYLGRLTDYKTGLSVHAIRLDDGRALYVPRKDIQTV